MKENLYTVKILDEEYTLELRKLFPDLKVLFYKYGTKSKIVPLSKISYSDIDFDSNKHICITEKHSNIINEYKRKQSLLKEEFIKQINESL